MSSFTSNFRSEARVLLIVLAAIAAVEGALRLWGDRLSSDIAHIRTIPSVASGIAGLSGTRVLFIGNSLTRHGLHLEDFDRGLGCPPGSAVSTARVYPDDTTVLDWYYLYRKEFVGRSAPDVLVLQYVRGQLSDATQVHGDRIAAYFGGWSVAREVMRLDMPTLGDRIDYALSSTFLIFAERERVSDRILAFVAPDYRKAARRVNEATQERTAGGEQPAKGDPYTRLERLLRLAAERRTHVVIVAMPQLREYRVDPRLTQTIQREGGVFVDMRDMKGLGDSEYLDGYHLSDHGAAIYSGALGRRLRSIIPGCWDAGPLAPVIGVS